MGVVSGGSLNATELALDPVNKTGQISEQGTVVFASVVYHYDWIKENMKQLIPSITSSSDLPNGQTIPTTTSSANSIHNRIFS